MSTQKNVTQSRRNFLKAAAYTSALSVGGLSSFALAKDSDVSLKTKNVSDMIENNISVMQQKMLHKETVSLFNNNNHAVTLDAKTPINIEHVNGSLIVKPNVVDSVTVNDTITMMPSERIAFEIQTTGGIFSSAEIKDVSELKGQLMHISSQHSGFNRLIPVANTHVA